jgi:multidrug resistance efflux pump
VTPNVAGQVTEIDVQPNTLEEVGAILFQIERAPYQYKVKQLQSALAEARQKVERLKSNIELASADVKAVTSQLTYAEKRRDDIVQLARSNATTEFRLQDASGQVDLFTAQLAVGRERRMQSWRSDRRSRARTRRSHSLSLSSITQNGSSIRRRSVLPPMVT